MKRLRQAVTLLAVLGIVGSSVMGPVGLAAADHDCTVGHSMFLSITNTAGVTDNDLGCQLFHGDTDSVGSKTDIYQSGQTTKEHNEVYFTTADNYLNDTESIALMVGKNAYIRALNNGSSESAARTEAKIAVSDYYVTKQINLIESWNTTVENWDYYYDSVQNDSGIANDYTQLQFTKGADSEDPYYQNVSSNQVTLANGSSHGSLSYKIRHPGNSPETDYIHIKHGNSRVDTNPTGSLNYTAIVRGTHIKAPTSEYEKLHYVDFSEWVVQFNDYGEQNSKVHDEIDTFINNTYSEYQEGEINNSDLVDPYIAAREYEANGSFQSWSMMQLSLLEGATPPEDLDTVGHFEVTDETDGNQYDGMLLSDENPESGQFEANTTYNSSKIGGPQFVVTDSDMIELTGNFTLGNITNSDGERLQNVTMKEVNYSTANTTEYRELMDELNYLRAQIDSRNQALVGGGLGSIGGNEAAVIVVAAVAVLILKD